MVVWSRNATFDSEPAATVLASSYDGKRLNSPNDAVLHPVDRSIYFTDPSWGIINKPVESQGLPCHGVFQLDPGTGNVSVVLDNLAMPNGITFSPEGDILYVSDTGARPDHANPAFASSAKPPSMIRAWAFANGAVASPDSPLWTVQDFSDGMCFVGCGRLILATIRASPVSPSPLTTSSMISTTISPTPLNMRAPQSLGSSLQRVHSSSWRRGSGVPGRSWPAGTATEGGGA